jgi:hypothetical protein
MCIFFSYRISNEAYANWNQCDEKIVDIVKDGANVVIWFSINLSVDSSGNPLITSGPDMDCVADIVKRITDLQLNTTHLISIGGWNSPHPDTTNAVEDTYSNWNNWNRNVAARPEKGFFGFDGFDWDIEGSIIFVIFWFISLNYVSCFNSVSY